MVKKILHAAIYPMFFVNLYLAIRNGFHWTFYVASGLTAVVLLTDIVEVIRRGRN